MVTLDPFVPNNLWVVPVMFDNHILKYIFLLMATRMFCCFESENVTETVTDGLNSPEIHESIQ